MPIIKELTDKKQKEVQSAQPVPIESKRQDGKGHRRNPASGSGVSRVLDRLA
jgi:hypothetical protein